MCGHSAATEHAAGHGDATERPGGTVTDLCHLTDVDMTSGVDRKTHPVLEFESLDMTLKAAEELMGLGFRSLINLC